MRRFSKKSYIYGFLAIVIFNYLSSEYGTKRLYNKELEEFYEGIIIDKFNSGSGNLFKIKTEESLILIRPNNGLPKIVYDLVKKGDSIKKIPNSNKCIIYNLKNKDTLVFFGR